MLPISKDSCISVPPNYSTSTIVRIGRSPYNCDPINVIVFGISPKLFDLYFSIYFSSCSFDMPIHVTIGTTEEITHLTT